MFHLAGKRFSYTYANPEWGEIHESIQKLDKMVRCNYSFLIPLFTVELVRTKDLVVLFSSLICPFCLGIFWLTELCCRIFYDVFNFFRVWISSRGSMLKISGLILSSMGIQYVAVIPYLYSSRHLRRSEKPQPTAKSLWSSSNTPSLVLAAKTQIPPSAMLRRPWRLSKHVSS